MFLEGDTKRCRIKRKGFRPEKFLAFFWGVPSTKGGGTKRGPRLKRRRFRFVFIFLDFTLGKNFGVFLGGREISLRKLSEAKNRALITKLRAARARYRVFGPFFGVTQVAEGLRDPLSPERGLASETQ